MKNMLLFLTGLQTFLTIWLLWIDDVDGAICISTFLGLTGSRQAFSYLYLTNLVPITHISFLSMWFRGSLGLVILVQGAYFYWLPYWKYFIIFNICLGILVTSIGSFFLIESPMHLLIRGKQLEA